MDLFTCLLDNCHVHQTNLQHKSPTDRVVRRNLICLALRTVLYIRNCSKRVFVRIVTYLMSFRPLAIFPIQQRTAVLQRTNDFDMVPWLGYKSVEHELKITLNFNFCLFWPNFSLTRCRALTTHLKILHHFEVVRLQYHLFCHAY